MVIKYKIYFFYSLLKNMGSNFKLCDNNMRSMVKYT